MTSLESLTFSKGILDRIVTSSLFVLNIDNYLIGLRLHKVTEGKSRLSNPIATDVVVSLA